MWKFSFVLSLVCHVFIPSGCLDNGLALTPPMGWLTWERFRCNTDCKNDPENCISEHLIKVMADRLAADGFLDAGYQYITIDDCWPEHQRDDKGRLQPDHERFPNGIKALTDYVHTKGLKFGIYEDFGVKTCAGYPGSEFYMQTDAQTFADWGVDLLKFDGCNSNYKDDKYVKRWLLSLFKYNPKSLDPSYRGKSGNFGHGGKFGHTIENSENPGYPAMKMFLNLTGRPIVYSCEWPLQNKIHHTKADYKAVSETCNFWRNYDDVADSWDSIRNIIEFYGEDVGNFSSAAKPGAWNDPDMLVIGNYGLSPTQERTQMAMWAMFAAPLVMSVDLRNIRQSSKDILLNPRVIAVNQDKLGIAGHRIIKDNKVEVWARPLSPSGSAAIVFLNLNEGGYPLKVTNILHKLGLTSENGYTITETFEGTDLGKYKPMDIFSCIVEPTGVFMITARKL